MKLRTRQLGKVALGLLLIVFSALIAVVIRNALAAQSPENALPQLAVYYSGTESSLQVPSAHIRRDTYSWRFLFWHRAGGGKDLEIWREIIPVELQGNTPLALGFDITPTEVYVAVSANEGASWEDVGGQLAVPLTVGTYIYRIDAAFGTNRQVRYYLRIAVPW